MPSQCHSCFLLMWQAERACHSPSSCMQSTSSISLFHSRFLTLYLSISLSSFLSISLLAASARVVDRCALSHVPRPQLQPVHAQQLIIISCSFQAVLRPRTTTSSLLPTPARSTPQAAVFHRTSTINFTFCDLSSHKLESRQRLRLAVLSLPYSPSLHLPFSKICFSFARVVIVFPSFCVPTSHVAL